MTMPEVPALSVGAVLGDGDSGSMAWSRAIGDLSMRVQRLRESVDAPVRLSVVYHVDGRLAPNNFEGVQTGRFDKGANRLVVQVAVNNTSAEGKQAILISLLHDAVGEAERYLRKKGLAADLRGIRGLVDELACCSRADLDPGR